MDNAGLAGTLLDEAKRKAEIVFRSFDESSRFNIATCSPLNSVAGGLLGRKEALDLIASIRQGGTSKSTEKILEKFQMDFENLNAEDATHHVFLLSDFQKLQHNLEKLNFDRQKPDRIVLIPIQTASKSNAGIDSAWMLTEFPVSGSLETIFFRIKNYGREELRDIPVHFLLNGEKKSTTVISLSPGSFQEIQFRFQLPSQGSAQIECRIEDGSADFDNKFYALVKTQYPRRVLIIHEEDPTPLKKALATEPAFQVTVQHVGQINLAALKEVDAIFVLGLKSWSPGLASVLKEFTQSGGDLILFPPANLNNTIIPNAFEKEFSISWPGALRNDPQRVLTPDLNSPFFQGVFDKHSDKLDMPLVNSYYTTNWPGEESILLLQSGQSFLKSIKLGSGRITACMVSLDKTESNFTRHAFFVPVILRLVIQSRPLSPLYHIPDITAAKNFLELSVSDSTTISETPFILRNISSGSEFIPEQNRSNKKVILYFHQLNLIPGFYEVLNQGKVVELAALNSRSSESTSDYYSQEELQTLINSHGWDFIKIISSTSHNLDQEFKSSVWGDASYWFPLLLAAAVFAIFESLFSRAVSLKLRKKADF